LIALSFQLQPVTKETAVQVSLITIRHAPIQYRERSDRMPHSRKAIAGIKAELECHIRSLGSRYCTGRFTFCANHPTHINPLGQETSINQI
jgi:hypothetical protein